MESISRIALLNPKSSDPEIVIDADASTGIPTFDLDHLTEKERANLLHEGPGFPYMLRPGAKTLVIGPGGGWDVARSLTGGSKDVTAVEINPIIAHTIMQQRFADLSHRLYFRPEVHLFVEDGRSFVRRSPGKISGFAGHASRYLGLHRGRSFRAFGKQSLHHRRLSRLSESLDG